MSRNLLELTAISGEFPQKDLYRIAGGKSYKESVVGTLKREGLIKTYYRDSLRGLRLTCRAKKLLVQNIPERFKTLLTGKTDTNHIKSDLPRIYSPLRHTTIFLQYLLLPPFIIPAR